MALHEDLELPVPLAMAVGIVDAPSRPMRPADGADAPGQVRRQARERGLADFENESFKSSACSAAPQATAKMCATTCSATPCAISVDGEEVKGNRRLLGRP